MLSRPRMFAIALGVVAGSLGGVTPASASGAVVRPGESIQRAVDRARPGDTVTVASGVCHENVTNTKNGITLSGAGAGPHGTVLEPAYKPTASACTPGPYPKVNGVCVSGANGVTVKELAVEGFPGTGIFASDVRDYTVARVRAGHNAGYGIAGFGMAGVRYLDSVATENGAPGIYVGDSPDAQAIVRGNTAIKNGVGSEGFGFLIRDSSHGRVVGNHASGNCVGFFFLDHIFNADATLSEWSVERNTATANNGACAAIPEAFPAFSGIGILLGGTHMVTVTGNVVLGNRPTNDSGYAGGIVLVSTEGAPFFARDPEDNVVSHNIVFLNRPGDIVWDGTGTGNRFQHNLCGTCFR